MLQPLLSKRCLRHCRITQLRLISPTTTPPPGRKKKKKNKKKKPKKIKRNHLKHFDSLGYPCVLDQLYTTAQVLGI
eukprot:m.330954 g.330954  ORF g.330954 m.330954 type:complete len:76 (+) comp16615_c0_seq1:615-842(+)